jgi:hypothetical protein
MFWIEHFIVDRQCSFVERPRFNKAALALNRIPQVIQAHCGIGMFGTKDLFADRQRTFQKNSCLRIGGRLDFILQPMQQFGGPGLRTLRQRNVSVDQCECERVESPRGAKSWDG